MNLNDYEWSGNPRGLVARGPFIGIDRPFVSSLRPGWLKIRSGTDEYIDDVTWLIESGITPIIQIIRDKHVGEPCSDEIWYYTEVYLQKGVKFFEFYTEPNLPENWLIHHGYSHYPFEVGEGLREFCENWIDWAERIVNVGGYPAFPAMNEVDEEAASAFALMAAAVNYFKINHENRFKTIGEGGLFLAVHPEMKNLFYQEVAGSPATPRPPAAMDAKEGGWHFEFPEDPLVVNMVGEEPDDFIPAALQSGLLSSSRVFQHLIRKNFGIAPVPVFTVGGGIPLLEPPATFMQYDRLYPAITADSFVESQIALWDWIAEFSPNWLFGSAFIHLRKLAASQPEYLSVLAQKMIERPPVNKVLREETKTQVSKKSEVNPIPHYPVSSPDYVSDDGSTEVALKTAKMEISPNLALAFDDLPRTWISLEGVSGIDELASRVTMAQDPSNLADEVVSWVFLTPSVDRDIFLAAAKGLWGELSPVIIPDLELLVYPPDDVSIRIIMIATEEAEADIFLKKIRLLRAGVACEVVLCKDVDTLTESLDAIR